MFKVQVLYSLKLWIKDGFMNQIVNKVRLTQYLAQILKT